MLAKQAVTDFDHFRQEFVAGSNWTEIQLPLSGFAQAGWGKKLPTAFDDVAQIQFSPSTFSRPFDLSVDHIELSPDDVVLTPVAYATEKWFAYRGTDPVKRRGTALDVSRLLDAPAGKHGLLKRQGENFVFANGKPLRFLGRQLGRVRELSDARRGRPHGGVARANGREHHASPSHGRTLVDAQRVR